MSQIHVSKDGKCIYCGSKMIQCPICGDWFLQKNRSHIICLPRCRTRKSRRRKFDVVSEVLNTA